MLLNLIALVLLQAAPADITGTWQIKGDIMGSPLNTVCALKQDGTAITGTCQIEGAAAADVKGEVKDGKVTFQHGGDYEGQALTVVYSGTLVSPTELKGTIMVNPFDVGGEFTATPAPK
jgi:hypothetical protein